MDLEYLLFLQSLREGISPAVTSALVVVSELVTGMLPILTAMLLYWCVDKQAGTLMVLSMTGAPVLNQTIKNTACVYRPWIRSESLHLVDAVRASAGGYSFPSGHTTMAVAFYGSLARWLRQFGRIFVPLCMTMAVLTAFARNWLGAHTPQDVVVAFVVSLLFMKGAAWLLEWVHRHPERDLLVAGIGLALCAAMLIYVTVKPYPLDYAADGSLIVDPAQMLEGCYTAAGGLSGFLIGWALERRLICFRVDGCIKRRVLRFVFGVLMVLCVYKVSGAVFRRMLHADWHSFMSMLVVVLAAVAGYPAIVAWAQRRYGEGSSRIDTKETRK